jgi:hypothetical protein
MNTWNITLLSFFHFYFSIFLGSRTARTAEPIFMVDGSKRAFWRKEVLLRVWSMTKQNRGRDSLKTPILGPVKQFHFLKRIAISKKTVLDTRKVTMEHY